MKHTLFKRVLLIPMTIIIFIGVAIIGWILAGYNRTNSINIRIESGETESIEFNRIGLIPGEECRYDVHIKGKEDFVMRLDFVESGDPELNRLKEFAYVKIIAGGETLCDELIVDIFDHEEFVLPVVISEDINTELTIIYYLPIEVGNEAKNAQADFDLIVRASEE